MFRVALFSLSCFIPLLLIKLVLFLTRQNIIEINSDVWCKKRSFKLDVRKTRKTTTTKRDLCENLKKFCCRFVVVGWRTMFHNFHGVLNKKDENILEFSVYLAPRYGDSKEQWPMNRHFMWRLTFQRNFTSGNCFLWTDEHTVFIKLNESKHLSSLFNECFFILLFITQTTVVIFSNRRN